MRKWYACQEIEPEASFIVEEVLFSDVVKGCFYTLAIFGLHLQF